MRLRDFLRQPGGVSETGREVTFKIRYEDHGPKVRDVTAIMLPISEAQAKRVEDLARETSGKKDAPLSYDYEYVVRLLQASLRSADDPSKLLIESEKDLGILREGLVAVQYAALALEYRQLIEQEYPEIVSAEQGKELEEEARDFFGGGQPERG